MSENKSYAGFKNGKVEADPCDGTAKECNTSYQNKVNAEREKYFASLTPEMRERYAMVHAAASLLDKAKIPFLLCAIPEDEDREPLAIQYQRFSYRELYDEKGELIPVARLHWAAMAWEIIRTGCSVTSISFPTMEILFADDNGYVIRSIKEGKTVDYPRPPEGLDIPSHSAQDKKNE